MYLHVSKYSKVDTLAEVAREAEFLDFKMETYFLGILGRVGQSSHISNIRQRRSTTTSSTSRGRFSLLRGKARIFVLGELKALCSCTSSQRHVVHLMKRIRAQKEDFPECEWDKARETNEGRSDLNGYLGLQNNQPETVLPNTLFFFASFFFSFEIALTFIEMPIIS